MNFKLRNLVLTILTTGTLLFPHAYGLAAPIQSNDVTIDPMQSYIVTGQTLNNPPLYQNGVAGAAHLMRTSSGTYYAYASGEEGPWTITTSNDLVSWSRLPNDAAPQGTWGKSHFWVPKVIEDGGKYYMFYCAWSDTVVPSQRIGLAIADRPEGPFKDIGHPLFDGMNFSKWYTIDPNPFIDPDTGEKYLYFVYLDDNDLYFPDYRTYLPSSRVFGIRLADDMMSVVGEPTLLLPATQSWEFDSYLKRGTRRLWLEAPEIFKANGTYYIMYSANGFQTPLYAIGSASASQPLGPYTKFDKNPVLSSVDNIEKTGHNTAVPAPDNSEYFTAYTTLGEGRYLSKVGFRDDGTLFVNGPISGYQVKPNGTTQYVNHAQQAMVTVSSTQEPYRVNAITDGEVGIYERLERYEWVSKSEKMGARITLTWDTPRCVEYVMLYDSAIKSRKIKTGHILLNNDPKQVIDNITFPDGPGEAAILRFPEKKEITSLTFVVDQLQDPAGVAGMSEIVVLGYPEGHVWLSSPIPETIQKGIIPIEIQGIHEPVANVIVTLTPSYEDIVRAPMELYSANSLPRQLVFDTLQLQDGAYDLLYVVTMATGKTVTVKNRIAVDNWTALEDLIQAPLTGGWFGEVVRMQTLSRSAGWKFTGDETNLLFGDSDRIIREAATQESLVWQLPRLKNFAFTMYARSQQINSTVQIAVSADGEAWNSTPYSTRVLEKSDSGWLKLSVESPAPLGDDVSLVRLTFTGESIAPIDLQLGHATLNGLVEGTH